MILLILASILQLMLIYERVLNKFIMLFAPSKRSPLKKITDNIVLGNYCSQIIALSTVPLQMLLSIWSTLLANLTILTTLLVFISISLVASNDLGGVVSIYVNTYNQGVGGVIDQLFLKPLQLLQWIIGNFVPIYNSIVWFVTRLVANVLVPNSAIHIELIPQMIRDSGLFVVSLLISLSDFMRNALVCAAVRVPVTSNSTTPFIAANLQCIGNTNYISIDLMTPGIYSRKFLTAVYIIVSKGCPFMVILFELVIYPFLDFNLYKAVHGAVNMVTHLFISLPITTYRRCQYARGEMPVFTDIEQAVMCTPDWSTLTAMTVSVFRAVGTLVDNWLNMALHYIEINVGSTSAIKCDSVSKIGTVWTEVSGIFADSVESLRVVGLTPNMYAVTDGMSTAYHTMTDGGYTKWAVSNFPFRVNTGYGIAAIKYGETSDPDAHGDSRTGMLGCECLDEIRPDGAHEINIVCASIPYQVHVHDTVEAYENSTIHRVRFETESTAQRLTCKNTLIRVSSLRFSRKRFSVRRTSGIETAAVDPFGFVHATGNQDPESYTADAAIYVQPKCSLTDKVGSCVPDVDNCYPWCMGLHIAGQTNQAILVKNARTWDNYVLVSQMDCVVNAENGRQCPQGEPASAVNMDTYFNYTGKCAFSERNCEIQDHTDTLVLLNALHVHNTSALGLKAVTHASIRTTSQPFAAAADIFLYREEYPKGTGVYRLVISRMYDNNAGDYSLQQERLTLTSNAHTIELKMCDTLASSMCYANAVRDGNIILPTSYFAEDQNSPVVSSEWAVHWAVNPENAVFDAVIEYCQRNNREFTYVASSSYSKARVWTLNTMRASHTRGGSVEDDAPAFSYMIIPEWLDIDVMSFDDRTCDKMFNFKIVGLEYLNEENVLVTTLYTTLRNYRPGGKVCDGCLHEYRYYFLNPNRHDCIEPAEGEDAIFSCWKNEQQGIFAAQEQESGSVFGVLCPAMQRMPQVGSMVAEAGVSSVELLKIVLDLVTVIPAALSSGSSVGDIYNSRLIRPTFHDILDNAGSPLLNVDRFLAALDKSSLHLSNIIVKLGNFVTGNVHDVTQPILIGTAKIIQHMNLPAQQAGSLLGGFVGKKLNRLFERMKPAVEMLKKVPVDKVMQQFAGATKSMSSMSTGMLGSMTAAGNKQLGRLPPLVQSIRASFMTSVNAMKMNMRFTRRILVKAVKMMSRSGLGATASLSVIQSLLSNTLYESAEDIDRSFIDNLNVMCDGFGQIFGYTNPWARTMRHACLLVPATFRSSIVVLKVLLVEYVIMDCVCKIPEEHVRLELIESTCLRKLVPISLRVWMLNIGDTPGVSEISHCFRNMDYANRQLTTSFDPVFSRLSKLTTAFEESLDYLLTVSKLDTGSCTDFEQSPYVVALMPEPVDYFMACMHTFDCRIKCLDTFNAFDEALSKVGTPPTFESTEEVVVDSKYFSTDDMQNDRHLAPFEVLAIHELQPDACVVICSEGYVRLNRCIVAVGLDDRLLLGIAYYCIPADITQYVYEFVAMPYNREADVYIDTWPENEAVVDAYMMSTSKVTQTPPFRDDILVHTKNIDTQEDTLYVFHGSGSKFILLKSELFAPEKYDTYTRDTFNSINRINVITYADKEEVDVFVSGFQVVYTPRKTSSIMAGFARQYTTTPTCARVTVYIDAEGFDRPFSTRITDCQSQADSIFQDDHLHVCLNVACTEMIAVPQAAEHDTFVKKYNVDRDSLAVSNVVTYKAVSQRSKRISAVIGLDNRNLLYVTRNKRAVANTKRLSSMARLSDDGVRLVVDIMLAGTVDSHRSWIQSVRLQLDPEVNEFRAMVFTSTQVMQQVGIKLECSIDNCVGCQPSTGWRHAYVELQSKCFAASSCALRRCVATRVNMRKPLCNLAKIATNQIDQYRLSMHTAWIGISHTIISIVELTHSRRREYEIAWPEEAFVASICLAKDNTVEAVSTIMSVIGAASAEEFRKSNIERDTMRGSRTDSKYHARFIMGLTASTQFVSSVAMWPIYAQISIMKVFVCGINDVTAIIETVTDTAGTALGRDTRVKITLGSKRIQEATRNAPGMCMSSVVTERMREMSQASSVKTLSTQVAQVLDQISALVPATWISMKVRVFDVVIVYMISIVNGIIDMIQTFDWYHCKMPSISNVDISKCVCQDNAFRITKARRTQNVNQHAFWCTGPLLMTASDGSDMLVWNPYPFDLLTSSSHEAYIACITRQGPDCERLAPLFRHLRSQGVSSMQVITRCRHNYNNKQWDQGAMALGLFTREEWQGAPDRLQTAHHASNEDMDDTVLKARLKIGLLSSMMTPTYIDEQVWECLRRKLTSGNWNDECMLGFITGPLDSYFMYEASVSDTFNGVDACQVYSGKVKPFAVNSAARSPGAWSASSVNPMPLTERHHMIRGAEAKRIADAQTKLTFLVEHRIKPALRNISSSVSKEVEMHAWSLEGDELHQFVDCVVLGPYASADMHTSFQTSSGRRLPVPQYHRGDPTSRKFVGVETTETVGSESRRNIMKTVIKAINTGVVANTVEIVINRINLIKSKFSQEDQMKCLCHGKTDVAASMDCCISDSVRRLSDIKYPLSDFLKGVFDLKSDVLSGAFDSIADEGILSKDVWTNSSFAFESVYEFSEEELEEMARVYLFNHSDTVYEYSTSEVPRQLTSQTLWQTCTGLLSASFFTIPLKHGGMDVDVDMTYNPAKGDSAGFLHGMEEVIHTMLQKMRAKSPVFWKHVHRYVPSKSVWCESPGDPVPRNQDRNLFSTSAQWHDMEFTKDSVRGTPVDDVVFVGSLGGECLCGWASESQCEVRIQCADLQPPESLTGSWQVLCGTGVYTTRTELFMFMHILQTSLYSQSVILTCSDLVPSVVWGLLRPDQQREWFAGSDTLDSAMKVGFQNIAVNGPSGVRLGMLGTSNHSLYNFVRDHDLLRKHLDHQTVNYAYSHTIAQPVCADTLQASLKSDLSLYFRDVFFPMAHSVTEAPASAYCSTWAIEFAIHAAMVQIYRDSDNAEVIRQHHVVTEWKRRCDIQLQQLGICVLRGVFDIQPASAASVPESCAFKLHPGHGCGVFYVTSGCVVRCDDDFYDPCKCGELSQDCSNVVFAKSSCVRGKMNFNPTKHVTDESVRLYSMHWPAEILYAEVPTNDKTQAHADLQRELLLVKEELRDLGFVSQDIYNDMMNVALQADEGLTETTAPQSNCDDLLDYFDADAQHPVGYHPTCACLKSKSNMRGFDSWMSAPVDGTAWAVDPLRHRNMTDFSTTYGFAHMVCDASVYGVFEHQLNPFYLSSRWDREASADPSVPVYPGEITDFSVLTEGEPSHDYTDTPLVGLAIEGLVHTAGLVRDWMQTHGPDSELSSALQDLWPSWNEDDLDMYGAGDDDILPNCVLPPLMKCSPGSDDCCVAGKPCVLICQSNNDTDPTTGICVQQGTCFQHRHCESPTLCSGDGLCVNPTLFFSNHLDVEVDLQLFSRDTDTCDTSTYGYSPHEGVSDFATSNGMCSMRDWFHYRSLVHGIDPVNNIIKVSNRVSPRTDSSANEELDDQGVLKMQPHACDRSYQHTTYGICKTGKIIASASYNLPGPNAVPPLHSSATRTWEQHNRESGNISMRFCDMRGNDVNGFLSPYVYNDPVSEREVDTLLYVPSTVMRCWTLNICPEVPFSVQGLQVQQRRVLDAKYHSSSTPSTLYSTTRTYSNTDADKCMGVGYLMQSDNRELYCAVDRYIAPLLDSLFHTAAGVHIGFLPTQERDQATLYTDIMTHCKRAFTRSINGKSGLDLFREFSYVLTRVYQPSDAVTVAEYANWLLPSLFGISRDQQTRGFASIDNYMTHADCAIHVAGLLKGTLEIGRIDNPYRTESINAQTAPGASLYMFHERGVVYMPFRWFWQCVVLSTPGDGGAPEDWFDRVTDPESSHYSTPCVNYSPLQQPRLHVKKILQTSLNIFAIGNNDEVVAGDIVRQIDNVVGTALSLLKIPSFPNIRHLTVPVNTVSCGNIFHDTGVCSKSGSLVSELLKNDVDLDLYDYNGQIRSLYVIVRNYLMGDVSAHNFTDYRLSDFESRGIMEVDIDLDESVPANTLTFPAIRFASLDVIARPASNIERIHNSSGSIPWMSGYVSCQVAGALECQVYNLHSWEFRVQGQGEIDFGFIYTSEIQRRRFITQEEARYLVLTYVKNNLYFEKAFTSGMLRVNNDMRWLMHTSSMVDVKLAREYNSFMRRKTFECSGEVIKTHLQTNKLHGMLQQCLSDLREDVGWRLKSKGVLRLQIPSSVLLHGFLASFQESDTTDSTFLGNLTHRDWIKSKYVALQDQMCYSSKGKADVINPYWSTHFDAVHGCDVLHRNGLTLIDDRCLTTVATETCASRFPKFAEIIDDKMPGYCRDHSGELTTTVTGTFGNGYTELCDLRFESPPSCERRHGTFMGAQGTTVADLHAFNEPVKQSGVWARSNAMFRGRTELLDAPDMTSALGIDKGDIAGHSLEFAVNSEGRLRLKCVHLRGDPSETCRVSNQHWMADIETFWVAQHRTQNNSWPQRRYGPGPTSWKCPLQWFSAYSGKDTDRRYQARSPDRLRNHFRFRHITHNSSFAHPIVSNLAKLRTKAARFIHDTMACTAYEGEKDSVCHGSGLLSKALRDVRSSGWIGLDLKQGALGCQRITDWPHQPFSAWDHSDSASGSSDDCSIHDRLPSFQLRYARNMPSGARSRTSVSAGGVCRMGRLRRVTISSAPHLILQHCYSDADSRHCKFLNTNTRRAQTETMPDIPAYTARRTRQRRNTHCAHCEDHSTSTFVDHAGGHSMLPTENSQLSVGRPMALSTERVVASFLRRHVCVNASGACPQLDAVFDSSRWVSGSFLRALMTADNASGFFRDWVHVESPEQKTRVATDDLLWARNWVFCDQSGGVDSTCNGSITKSEWLEPSTREQVCKRAVSESKTNTQTEIHFCLIDANTERLCQHLVEWDGEIRAILCQAAGLSECPEAGFFYNPAAYSLENKEFTHDSIQSYYDYSSPGTCPAADRQVQAQLVSNDNLLDKCASVWLVPIKVMLQASRDVVQLLAEILFYCMQIGLQTVTLVVTVFLSPASSDVGRTAQAIGAKILQYANLLIDTIREVWEELSRTIFQFVFGKGYGKAFVALMKMMCNMVNWLYNVFVVDCACAIMEEYINFLGGVAGFCDDVTGLTIEILGGKIRPLASFAYVCADIRKSRTGVIQKTIGMCDKDKFDCDALELGGDTLPVTGTLPAVTRCWSTYVTFYGDDRPLSCTQADTCKLSALSQELVPCIACPRSTPPNPLTHQYGCDTSLKQCVCGVPRTTKSFCFSNEECAAPEQSCAYIDSDLEPMTSLTPCQTCSTERICYMEPGHSTGYCACGLFNLAFARCGRDDHTQTVALPYAKMCILQTDPAFRASINFRTDKGSAAATPCMAVDPSSAFCSRVDGEFFIVATAAAPRRRLLQAQDNGTGLEAGSATTHSPACQDAMNSPTQTHMRAACVAAYVYSADTVSMLGLAESVPACTFCSVDDFMWTVTHQPVLFSSLALRPGTVLPLIFRHTPLRHLKTLRDSVVASAIIFRNNILAHNLSDVLRVLRSDDGTYTVESLEPSLFPHVYAAVLQQGLNLLPARRARTVSAANASAHVRREPTRQLLSISGLVESLQSDFERVVVTHQSYAQQMSDAYNYNYPHLRTEQTSVWLEGWPPLASAAPGAQCAPARETGEILLHAIGNATLYYTTEQKPPGRSLRQSWPLLLDSKQVVTPHVDSSEDALLHALLWLVQRAEELVGFTPKLVYDLTYSLSVVFTEGIVCDLEAVQTCSKWRVTLGNGMIITAVYFCVWFAVCSAFQLSFVSAVTVPVFGAALMHLCYGYSPTCVPMVPTCLLLDVYNTIAYLFPKQIQLPHALWRNATCAEAPSVDPACIRNCADAPLEYDSWETVLAWVCAETGGGFSDFTLKHVSTAPFVNTHSLRDQIALKTKVMLDAEQGLVDANRLCAVLTSYRMAPYLSIIVVAVASLAAVVRIALAMLSVTITLVVSVFVALFVE